MTSGCVVRFFEPNDRIKKHLLKRIELEGASLEEGLAAAYHTLLRSPQTKDTLLSVEVELVNVPALVLAGA